ncbi:hypothetical protein A3L02_07435 [Thermococcus celer Vu 13 = JCM 8558]|uniref:DUF2357 domain-containing protein n=1 Tax=Thermococcus celer Vu 13 = JCM 8558 TaxID=1293037 RepID=A0A218P4W0_THECE|nr:hypothetical protein A3L02_07435 [Thermococcus celer Vu 13 = JCM 8558]
MQLEDGYELKVKGRSKGKEKGEPKLHEENGTIYLFEWKPYLLAGNQKFTLRLLNQETEAEEIKDGTYIAEFQLRNYTGKSIMEILKDGQPLLKKPIEVLSSKVLDIMGVKRDGQTFKTILNAHEEFYGALLEDIIRISPSLPFSIESPTGFIPEESDDSMNELFAYHYLRNNGERIREAFETVLRRARRKLVEEREWMEPYEVTEVSPDTLLSIAQHSEYLTPAEVNAPIAEYLHGHVPTRVLSSRKYESFDTPENRFAKYFLETLITWAERVIESFGGKIDLSPVKETLEELEFIRSHSLWGEVGEMEFFPYTSQTLLKGDGYRELLQLYREFTAYSPFFDNLWRAVENKDIATLYEYWAFFKLANELGEILRNPKLHIDVTLEGRLSQGAKAYASFRRGWRLYYNRKFVKDSYSVSVRPDFSLVKDGEVVGVFDAKFKLDFPDPEKFAEEDEAMETSPSLETWAKLEDIYKMHTYRDALKAKFAVVVYPGRRSVFFKVNREKKEPWALEDLISGGGVKIEGVGYIRLVPGVRG